MNILFLSTHLNVGGISSYLLSLSRSLKMRNHNIYIASSAGELLPRFIEIGAVFIPIPIKTKSIADPRILISLVKLSGTVKTKNIDVIHANTRVTQVLACLLFKFTGVPFISTCHGFFRPRLFRRIFPCWGRKVIAISLQVKNHLIRDFKIKEEDISIINNGIDIEKFPAVGGGPSEAGKSELRKGLNLKEGPVVGIIGRLSVVKGHKYLIKAMREVSEKMPGAQLLIVGDGRIKSELIALGSRLGILDKMIFIPSVIDTAKILSVMDLFIMPSLNEGLGLSLMEAMACGLAVIGSNVGGIKSLIRHDYNGLLVEPADTFALSRAIIELLNDPRKRSFLGKNARETIVKEFSIDKMAEQTERVYRQCLS